VAARLVAEKLPDRFEYHAHVHAVSDEAPVFSDALVRAFKLLRGSSVDPKDVGSRVFPPIPICVFQGYVSLTGSSQSLGIPNITTLDDLPGSCWPIKSDSSTRLELLRNLVKQPTARCESIFSRDGGRESGNQAPTVRLGSSRAYFYQIKMLDKFP
jgi:hypothetical protein